MEEEIMKRMLDVTSKALESLNSNKEDERILHLINALDFLFSKCCKTIFLSKLHDATIYLLHNQIITSHFDQKGKFLYMSYGGEEDDLYVYVRKVFDYTRKDDAMYNIDYLVHDFMIFFNVEDKKYCYNKICKSYGKKVSEVFKETLNIIGVKTEYKENKISF